MSAINIPKFDPSILISGGGDAELKVWDWLSGKHLGDIPVLSAVQPYIKAKAPPGHRGWHDNTDAGDEKPGRRRGKNKKGKGKEKEASETPQPENAPTEVTSGDVAMVDESTEPTTGVESSELAKLDEPVFVLRRIETVTIGEAHKSIVFSAVGYVSTGPTYLVHELNIYVSSASALFYTSFPSDLESFSSDEVSVLDLGSPVIEFGIAEDNKIWALLDLNFQSTTAPGTEPPVQSFAVRLASWNDGKVRMFTPLVFPPFLKP